MIETGKIVVVALGNRFRADDGAGLEVADRLKGDANGFTIVESPNDALAIMDAWQDAALAIVVDAAVTGQAPGIVHRADLGLGLLPKDLSRFSSHGLGLAEAIELSQTMGRTPRRMLVYGIEAASMALGGPVSQAVVEAAERVAEHIEADIASLRET